MYILISLFGKHVSRPAHKLIEQRGGRLRRHFAHMDDSAVVGTAAWMQTDRPLWVLSECLFMGMCVVFTLIELVQDFLFSRVLLLFFGGFTNGGF